VTLTNAGANIPPADIIESYTADIGLSDIYVGTTPYTGDGLTALTDTIVGVVPFEWVKGAYTPNGTLGSAIAGGYPGVTNVTFVGAQALLTGGIALNQFTGNIGDQAVVVGVVGLDHDSGIRNGALYDSDINGLTFGTPTDPFVASVLQYIPNGSTVGAAPFAPQSAGLGVISSLIPWPSETIDGETRPVGQEGFFRSSDVAAVLNRHCDTSSQNYIISYLGTGDANSVNPDPSAVPYTDGAGVLNQIHPSRNALTFAGNYPGTAAHPFAPPYANVIEGKYNFWGYEHYLYPTNLVGNQKTLADQISAQLMTEADFGGIGIRLSAMHASRPGDGIQVTSP
jgi:hypothetical protein